MKQLIPNPGFRVATGPVKFGDDWCGYFFRGDEIPTELLRGIARLLRGTWDCEREIKIGIADRLDREADKLEECLE
jgi:hypothetical protein